MNRRRNTRHQHNYILWLDTLQELSEEQAMTPYAEGKWSPNEIVMHLAEWRSIYAKERFPPYMKEGEKLDTFPNFESFNAKPQPVLMNKHLKKPSLMRKTASIHYRAAS